MANIVTHNIIVTDDYNKVQINDLNYIASPAGQKQIKRDTYKNLQEAFNDDNVHDIGQSVYLPSSMIGTPKWFSVRYQNAMAIIRDSGRKPDYFITMTCNPQVNKMNICIRNNVYTYQLIHLNI